MPTLRRPEPRTEPRAVPLSARLVAVGAAIVWGFLYFGIIDLLVVIIQDERFDEFYLLETGWGLLYTVLVAVPLVLFALRPRWQVTLQQVLVVAGAVLGCAVITPAAAQTVPAALLATTALLLSVWSGQGLALIRGWSIHGVNKGMATLALVAALSAVDYAAKMIQASRAGEPDDDTWGLMHLPMQAAFGLSVADVGLVAVLARAGRSTGWQVPALAAAASAAWLGLVSLVYPGHPGSLGRVGGAAAVAWSVAFAVGTLSQHRRPRGLEPPRQAEPGES